MDTQSVRHFDPDLCDAVIGKYKGTPGDLLSVLEEVQKQTPHNYLPEAALDYVARQMDVPLSRVFSVATFYSFFNLRPQGEHTITVCRGTACHTRGSRALLEALKVRLGAQDVEDEGEPAFTTPDNFFTVRTVACFGQCALAPVIALDGVIYSNVTLEQLEALVKKVASKRRKTSGAAK